MHTEIFLPITWFLSFTFGLHWHDILHLWIVVLFFFTILLRLQLKKNLFTIHATDILIMFIQKFFSAHLWYIYYFNSYSLAEINTRQVYIGSKIFKNEIGSSGKNWTFARNNISREGLDVSCRYWIYKVEN